MGKELTIGDEGTSIILSLNPFLLCHEFLLKELKFFLELWASYMTLIGNFMVNPFTCELVLYVDYMLKCSSLCAYFEKQLLVCVTRIKPSYHDLELSYDDLFFDLLVANFSSSCASTWSIIHILLEYFVESGYNKRISWFSWSLRDVFHAKLKGEFVENSLLFGNIHGFQFYHFHFKEFMWLLLCGKKMNDSFKVLKVHLCNLVKTTFENGVFQLTLKNLVEKDLVYSIHFIKFLFKDDILNDFLIQNTSSCVKLLNQSFGGSLLYSLTFNEFFEELIFKMGFKILNVLMMKSRLFFSLHQNFLFYHLPFKEIFWKHDLENGQVSTSKEFYEIY
ncbi:hypothetical protein M9H77_07261 [Catharanthus roseus]|uniref:Uncharacterized protein n=1 Tax=Catharanthus roseus TaxID=4058 RepID=A0ACC0BUJ8_CATRO|nr:hypothetical protein M9H77_07261 [Catharanthus roseus]